MLLIVLLTFGGLMLYSTECKVAFRNRIVNGEPTDISLFPYQLALYYKNEFYCGASLITSKIALTAGHCVSTNKNLLPKELLLVAAGSTYLRAGTVSRIAWINRHPDYDFKTLANDITVLGLATTYQFSSNINIVNLPPPNYEVPNGTNVTVSGWGATGEKDAVSNVLRVVNLLIIDQKVCKNAYMSFNSVTNSMVCAGVDNREKDACYGDSGGPLVYKNILIGIVSWGDGCARPGKPGVYTRVSSFIQFIKGAINKG